MAQITKPLLVYIPDTRGVQIARYGSGNLKIGLGVYTYSKLPGRPGEPAIGAEGQYLITDRESFLQSEYNGPHLPGGTCPGSTPECRAICYAARPVAEGGPVNDVWVRNTLAGADVPPIPEDAVLLRIHISGDFDSPEYINAWINRLRERPDVTAWAYTKSWRVPELLPLLEVLRMLPNMQLFASMDASAPDYPPAGWRRAWIYRDTPHKDGWQVESRLSPLPGVIYSKQIGLNYTQTAFGPGKHIEDGFEVLDATPSYVCPEETGYKKNCVECGYCFEGQKNDVTFLEH